MKGEEGRLLVITWGVKVFCVYVIDVTLTHICMWELIKSLDLGRCNTLKLDVGEQVKKKEKGGKERYSWSFPMSWMQHPSFASIVCVCVSLRFSFVLSPMKKFSVLRSAEPPYICVSSIFSLHYIIFIFCRV